MISPWAEYKGSTIGEPQSKSRGPPKELDGGSWARGRQGVFFGEQAGVQQVPRDPRPWRGDLGPDLSNLIHRDYRSVLRDITDPSFAINPDHLTYLVSLKDEPLAQRCRAARPGTKHPASPTTPAASLHRNRPRRDRVDEAVARLDDAGRVAEATRRSRMKDLLTFLLTNAGEHAPRLPRRRQAPEAAECRRSDVNAALARLRRAPPEQTRKIRIVLVAGPKDHGPGEHDYPAWQKAWKELLAAADQTEVVTAWEWPAKEEFATADVMIFFQHGDWTAQRAADIDAFLERGGGLVYVHWAVDGQKDSPGFAKRIGLAVEQGRSKFRHGDGSP